MADQSIISRHQSSVGTSGATLIDFGTTVQRVFLTTYSHDVHVEFNGTANGDSLRVSTSTTGSVAGFEFTGSNVRTVSLLGEGGTADVYVIGVTT